MCVQFVSMGHTTYVCVLVLCVWTMAVCVLVRSAVCVDYVSMCAGRSAVCVDYVSMCAGTGCSVWTMYVSIGFSM